jgi:putative ABC transport system ATP-binding protein
LTQPPNALESTTSAAEQLVRVDRASRRYALDRNVVTAIDDVSLLIAKRGFTAITGPSGSGKSTLLNLIGIIDRPSTGSVFIDGIDTGSLTPSASAALRREKIGFVFQSFNLIPVISVAENIEFPLLLQNIGKTERRRRVAEAIENVGLSARAGHRPDLLSGGERQRVAVARAIIHRPSLVLADEPTANLDTAAAMHLIELMRNLNNTLRITFLFSTHDQRLLDHASRVVRLCDGKIVEDSGETKVNHANISSISV